jgi:EAL domain-containing protein (putative c-di-GMP-specific phosphodiesterase class I)
VASSSESEVAVDTVIHLAHGLGVFVVAEGVTDPADLAALRRLGCDLVQGRAADSALGAGELLHRLGRPAGLDGDERPVS